MKRNGASKGTGVERGEVGARGSVNRGRRSEALESPLCPCRHLPPGRPAAVQSCHAGRRSARAHTHTVLKCSCFGVRLLWGAAALGCGGGPESGDGSLVHLTPTPRAQAPEVPSPLFYSLAFSGRRSSGLPPSTIHFTAELQMLCF